MPMSHIRFLVPDVAADVVLCLRVDNVDAEAKRLGSHGVTMLRAPHDRQAWYQRVAHFRDPAGRLVELWSPLS